MCNTKSIHKLHEFGLFALKKFYPGEYIGQYFGIRTKFNPSIYDSNNAYVMYDDELDEYVNAQHTKHPYHHKL